MTLGLFGRFISVRGRRSRGPLPEEGCTLYVRARSFGPVLLWTWRSFKTVRVQDSIDDFVEGVR